MKTSEIRRALRRRWPATVLVLVLATGTAFFIHKTLNSAPEGQATTQILVDSPSSSLVNVNVNSAGLTAQASVLAQAMTSQVVLQAIAKAADVPVGSISAQGPFNGAGEVLDIPTPSEARANQLLSVRNAYHVAFVAQPDVPIITVTVTGPNPGAAGHVADAALPGTEAWLSTIAASSTVTKAHQLVLRQLGDAQAGAINSRSAEVVAAIAAIAILILGLLGVVLVDRRLLDRGELRRAAGLGQLEQAFESALERATIGSRPANGAARERDPASASASGSGSGFEPRGRSRPSVGSSADEPDHDPEPIDADAPDAKNRDPGLEPAGAGVASSRGDRSARMSQSRQTNKANSHRPKRGTSR